MESIAAEKQKATVKSIDDIIYIESMGEIATGYLSNGDESHVEFNIGQLENMLPGNKFFRISNSKIVNFDYLKKIRVTSNKNIVLQGGLELELDLKKYRQLKWFLRNRYCVQ